jgi:cytoplasmic iron level regulating protein YaaA (DUF328/UPF0246 family)
MLMILSPAKRIQTNRTFPDMEWTVPDFLDASEKLVDILRKYQQKDLEKLMNINPDLARLNLERYMQWKRPFTPDNAQPAILAFQGDVYQKLEAETLDHDALLFAQEHLRILSGLYGVLRPLDLMQPYRLEMGTDLTIGSAGNLYEYWGHRITEALNQVIQSSKHQVLLNLASNEYFKSVDTKALQGMVISPVFKEFRNGKYTVFALFAKRARGLMARYVIRNRITDPRDIRLFSEEGYGYDENLSKENQPVFTR